MFLPWDGRRVPLTFVGGYLGAGKTTLINELLRETDRPIAVLVNDAGSVNVDASLVRRRHGDTIELTNGCVCCTSIDEMGQAFDVLRARPEPPDHVVVELSGVADPERMLPWGRSAGFRLDGLVVVVAADQLLDGALPGWITEQLESHVRAADLVVLTKTDLVAAGEVDGVLARLAELSSAPLIRAGRGELAPGALGRFLALGGRRPGGVSAMPAATLFDAHRIDTVGVPGGLTVDALRGWLDELPGRVAGRVVRAKGVVDTDDAGPVLVQVVGRRIEIEPVPEPEREPATDLVVITLAE
jgi:G3E family GTPase